jgi:hypothetical protein
VTDGVVERHARGRADGWRPSGAPGRLPSPARSREAWGTAPAPRPPRPAMKLGVVERHARGRATGCRPPGASGRLPSPARSREAWGTAPAPRVPATGHEARRGRATRMRPRRRGGAQPVHRAGHQRQPDRGMPGCRTSSARPRNRP